MTDQQIEDLANRLIAAIEHLAPGGPTLLTVLGAAGPFVALLAAYLVYRAAQKTLTQRQQADDRAEWWRRTQWALESASSENEKLSATGTEMILFLSKSSMASAEDKRMLDTAWEQYPALVDEQSAEEFEQTADDFMQFVDVSESGLNLDDNPETGDNISTKEADHG